MSEITDTARQIIVAGEKATPRPWNACHDGKCKCKQIWCKDYPVLACEDGEWGDKYPKLRQKADGTPEAYMEFIPYGSLADGEGTANAQYITLAANHAPALAEQVLADEQRIAGLQIGFDAEVRASGSMAKIIAEQKRRIADLEAEVERLQRKPRPLPDWAKHPIPERFKSNLEQPQEAVPTWEDE